MSAIRSLLNELRAYDGSFFIDMNGGLALAELGELENADKRADSALEDIAKLRADLAAAVEALRAIHVEARAHRIEYNYRCQQTERPEYWMGRRDEAGYLRDRCDAALASIETQRQKRARLEAKPA